MRLIDADALKTEINFSATITGKDNAIEVKRLMELYNKAINDAPTIDAEPVVRCKDCSYLDEDEFENGDVVLFCNFMRAELNDMEMDNESYCSNGKR